jgi:kinesin family protein 18/19
LDYLRAGKAREKKFAFDCVFSSKATQEEVFENTTAGLVHTVLDGCNATVFAYGATGAGKTYSKKNIQKNQIILVFLFSENLEISNAGHT